VSPPSPVAWHERLLATWRSPSSFTALVPVPDGNEEKLRAALAGLGREFEATLAAVDDLHSFRLVVVPANAPGMRHLHLLVNIVYDRPFEEHFAALMAAAGSVLRRAFTAAGIGGEDDVLRQRLVAHRVRENTKHLGAIGRSLKDIRQEQALREEVGLFADEALARGTWNPDTPAEVVRRAIREHIVARDGAGGLPTGPAEPISKVGRKARAVDLLKTFAFPAIGVLRTDIEIAIGRMADRGKRDLTRLAYALWWIYGAIPTGLALAGVRVLELIERDVELIAADEEKVERLESVEDLRLKNEVTYWFAVRDTWVRRQLLAIILWGSERGCRHFWTDGKLAGIDTIHYARILQLAGKRVMLFMSDYDGSLDRYLLDFTGVGSRAVIPIASNVEGSPKTRWLFGKENPTTFGPRLRNVLRTYQLETSVWYNAYPLLTVRDVLVNGAIREGLFAPSLSEEDARGWAELL
jgi:hypothetical protein